ncbi:MULTISPECIES: hypothetical protein [Flavobacterium]|uniref:hypothetical protein n=1 Tax=Flavobacterium TaxID=237 RepID=UPI001FCCB7F6|nr:MULTISPECIES: hypothetical protein [Flavobacterium]UOK42226.1 hypothetical protein LZF87_13015 [Flavobacterium enshiense]
MCKDCFDKQYYGFPSQTEFEKFEEILDLKCKSEKIKILESQNEIEGALMDFRMYYQCNTCKEKFVMSIPDNADRGYFLTEQNAIEYHERQRKRYRKENIGCIIILVIIIMFTIYSIIK